MIKTSISCIVAPLTTCNNATLPIENATHKATTTQQQDLIALSVEVLERNQRNQQCNVNATNQLRPNEANAIIKNIGTSGLNKKSCAVAFSKGGNNATQDLRKLIQQVSNNYGGDDSNFINEYTNDVIGEWSHNLQSALACFRDLAKQTPFNKWK
jgi:hypothetical protein